MPDVPDLLTSEQDQVAVRIPNHPLTLSPMSSLSRIIFVLLHQIAYLFQGCFSFVRLF
ncbi:MAG: hypothetical protein OXH57_03680 [Ekhidna sp.]|nr:hypothetical protein [Ekhidna sp.]